MTYDIPALIAEGRAALDPRSLMWDKVKVDLVRRLVDALDNAHESLEWPSVHDLADAHARYHDQAGNLIYENGCGWERCEFWDSTTTLLALRTSDDAAPGGAS